MKEIKHYYVLNEELIKRLNSRAFKFVKFSSDIKNIDLITIEEDSIIEGYAILEHSNNMNQDFYMDITSEIQDKYLEVNEYNIIQTRIENLELLNNTKEVLNILKEKNFYYISYLECIPSNKGNGAKIVEYIKENYKKTILIPSGYTFDDSSKEFWRKQGYKQASLLMFNA